MGALYRVLSLPSDFDAKINMQGGGLDNIAAEI